MNRLFWTLNLLVVLRMQYWINYWNIEPTIVIPRIWLIDLIKKLILIFEMTSKFSVCITISTLHSWNDKRVQIINSLMWYWGVHFTWCDLLTWFGHDFPAGQFVSVRSYLTAATTLYSGFFQLSLVTHFACDIGQLAGIWIWVPSEVITILVSIWISVDQLITS